MVKIDKDILFGTLAVQLRHATSNQVKECLRIQERLEAGGLTPKPLGEIMIEIGYLTPSQVEQITRSQGAPVVKSVAIQSSQSNAAKISDVSLQIPGYKIVNKIGIGKTGTVYKSLQLSLQRVVALKILLPHLARDKKFIERFFNEARAVALLNHANIVQGIDVGEYNGCYYFVMEYIDGPTLERLVKEKSFLQESLACDYILQVSRALEHAHKNGMVHRDVKPHNIMVNSSGIAKLCDLGIAKLRTHASTVIKGKARLIGTPAYIAPEQARGEKVDVRADIYSLGATFYYLITGSVPFPGETIAEVIQKHLTERPIPPIQRSSHLSKRINDFILKMMEKDKEKRYQSPTELIAVLENVQQPVQEIKRPLLRKKPIRMISSKNSFRQNELGHLKRLAKLKLRQKGRFRRV